MMKQSRGASLFETIGGTLLGFVLALAIQAGVCIYYDLPLSLFDNLGIIGVFTIASLIRGYVWRRACEALHVRRRLSPAMQAAIAERFRQQESEGYDHAHDDQVHAPGELACAAAAYAIGARVGAPDLSEGERADLHHASAIAWPWLKHERKWHGYRRDLVIAAALILAEIEKHDRNPGKARS